MEPFKLHRGIVVTLDRANIDTDQIIPKQFLKSIKRTGFGQYLFYDWRYRPDGKTPDPDFPLNADRFKGRTILVARNNFGCGSSREHAVWAIAQDGFKVVVAPARGEGESRVPAFADIFRNNCVKNGLLTIELTEDEVEAIFQAVERAEGLEATVDLEEQRLVLRDNQESSFRFDIDPSVKEHLMRGLDDIALTLEHIDDIAAFEERHDIQIVV